MVSRKILLVAFALGILGCTDDTKAPESASAPVESDAPTTEPDAQTQPAEDTKPVADGPLVLTPDVLALFELVPNRGLAEGEDSVALSGNGFQEGLTVHFGDELVQQVVFLDHKLINVSTPPGAPGVVDIRVENPDGQVVTLENGFRYYDPFGITSASPASGPLSGGTAISVEGYGFPPEATLLIGGREAINVEVSSDTSILGITPPGLSAGPEDIFVWTYAGATRLEEGFTYTENLTLELITPPYGDVSGGDLRTLVGTGFTPTMTITIDDAPAVLIEVASDGTTAFIETPAGEVGEAILRIETADEAESVEGRYFYLDETIGTAPLALLALLPNSGPTTGELPITVIASGLTNALDSVVSFGGSPANITAISPAQGTAEVLLPPGEAGPVDVALSTENGSVTMPSGFNYLEALTLSNVIPDSGPKGGGTLVRLEGDGLEDVTEVWFGPLPSTSIEFLEEDSIQVESPPGSPGLTDIRIVTPSAEWTLEDGFTYTTDEMLLLAVSPPEGPLGGNTPVQLYGTNLPEQGTVRFGKDVATNYTWISPTTVEVRTPSATQPGEVNVSLTSLDEEETVLLSGYTYVNPGSAWGGTWGGTVNGTLNVTVNDIWLQEGVENAYVTLWDDEETEYQGYTDWLGQISFTGPDLDGIQMVTAWKDGYSIASVVEFDAENITILLFPETPTDTGGGGGSASESPFAKLGTIEGVVDINNKYLVPPPGNCEDKPLDPQGVLCEPCETDEECGEGNLCTPLADGSTHCTTPCETGQDCPSGYACLAVSLGEEKRCMPITGLIRVRCETTRSDAFSTNPQPGDGTIADPVTGEFSIVSRTGELGVVCTGEAYDPETEDATPLAIGAEWPILVESGKLTGGLEIELDVPLERTIPMTMGYPPSKLLNLPHHRFRALIQFGSDGIYGVHEMIRTNIDPGTDLLNLEQMPDALTGSVENTAWLLMGGAYSLTSTYVQWFPPYSTAIQRDLPGLAESHLYTINNGEWSALSIPFSPISDIWGVGVNTVFAVGEEGALYKFDGSSWGLQGAPIEANWISVWGASANSFFAVANDGSVIAHDGSNWTSGGNVEFEANAIGGISNDAAFIVGNDGAAATLGAEGWAAFDTGTEAHLYGIWGSPLTNELWAVGAQGTILRLTENGFVAEESGTELDLYAIHGSSSGVVYACGASGTFLRRDTTGEWTKVLLATSKTLRDVWVAESGVITVVGTEGTILRVIEETGDVMVSSLEQSGAILKTVWGPDDQPTWIGGKDTLLFGPLLEVPEFLEPVTEGVLPAKKLEWKPVGGVVPDFTFIEFGAPWWKPIWQLIADGPLFHVDLPDMDSFEEQASIPYSEQPLQITRVRLEGFSIDNFDFFDIFFTWRWDAWAINNTTAKYN